MRFKNLRIQRCMQEFKNKCPRFKHKVRKILKRERCKIQKFENINISKICLKDMLTFKTQEQKQKEA